MSTMHLTDGYKLDHRRQYPAETCLVYSNGTPRKSRIDDIDWVVVAGHQGWIKRYLIKHFNENFFGRPKALVCAEYVRRINNYLGKNQIGIKHIEALHDLGYLPISIKTLPEGTRTRLRIPHITIKNTVDEFFWLVNYLETIWSCSTWQFSTSATLMDAFKKDALYWAELTGADKNFVQFQCHDFSMRGMSSLETAEYSGAGHLFSFVGTDTVPAIDYLEKYYGANSDNELVGCSVAATEHAVMCVGTGFYVKKNNLEWERYGEAEYAVFERLITEVYPTGILSIVSDTWNLWKVLGEYLPKLKDVINARDGKIVIRPDSGDPVQIMCGREIVTSKTHIRITSSFLKEGDKYYEYKSVTGYEAPQLVREVPEQEAKGVIQCLFDIFGGELNEKGYIRLNPKVGGIYGDSINRFRFNRICSLLEQRGFESTVWVAGVGSFTHQFNTRDTFGWAMKATYAEAIIKSHNWQGDHGNGSMIENEERVGIPIFKDPITDDGTKKSLKGLICVPEQEGIVEVVKDECTWEEENTGMMKETFRDGKLLIDQTLGEIRGRMAL